MDSPRFRNRLIEAILAPFEAFFRLESASGLLLMAAAVAAIGWANSPFAGGYQALLRVAIDGLPFHAVVNDVLMTLFFTVVGLEIKRELALGELASLRQALLPALAAAGGMALPAGIYTLLNRGTSGAPGWGIPVATDIAFSLGCVSLLGGRVPRPLVVFLTALAIFDDLGGILIIAFFYGGRLSAPWLLGAAGLLGLLAAMNRRYVRHALPYALAGAALWYALHHAGMHATLAGAITGLAVPARPRGSVPGQGAPLNRFVHALHPWVAYAITPLFALVNAGVPLAGLGPSDLLHRIPLGVALGLFLGKQLGIFLCAGLAVRLGLARMPGQASLLQLYGVAVVAGIGFTVSLFINSLAFEDPRLLDQGRLGILAGSLISALAGCAILRFAPPPRGVPA